MNVVVQPRRELAPMVISVPMRRDGDETELQVGHGRGESCGLEGRFSSASAPDPHPQTIPESRTGSGRVGTLFKGIDLSPKGDRQMGQQDS